MLRMEGNRGLKILSLTLLVTQGTVLPLLVRYSRIRKTKDMFLATSSVFFNELLKLTVCVAILIYMERSISKFLHSVYEAVVLQPVETLKVCVPSLIYTIQNNLYFIALSNLDASTYCVTYQLKILTTALFFVGMLNRPLSRIQWGSLLILMLGVSVVQVQEQVQGPSPQSATLAASAAEGVRPQNKVLGFAAVLTMCLTSGFAGVYFEKVLKGSHLNVWMQNVRLALLGIPLSSLTMLLKDWNAVWDGGIVRGFDWLVWTIILLNAAGGLIIAVVMKYADNILKAYAQSLAIVLACLGSGLWFNFVPTPAFILGTLLVIVSVFLYARFPLPRTTTGSGTLSPSAAGKIGYDVFPGGGTGNSVTVIPSLYTSNQKTAPENVDDVLHDSIRNTVDDLIEANKHGKGKGMEGKEKDSTNNNWTSESEINKKNLLPFHNTTTTLTPTTLTETKTVANGQQQIWRYSETETVPYNSNNHSNNNNNQRNNHRNNNNNTKTRRSLAQQPQQMDTVIECGSDTDIPLQFRTKESATDKPRLIILD